MLSDRERQALHQIQRQLRNEDPGFADHFTGIAERLPSGSSEQTRPVYTAMALFNLWLSMFAVFSGAPLGGLVFAAAAAVTWEMRRRRDGAHQHRQW